MKKAVRTFAILLVLAALVGGLIFAYLEMRKERDLEASAEAPVVALSRATITADGATLRLDAETQRRLGVEIAVLIKASVPDEVSATARVLDGSNLSTLLAEVRGAEAALDATRAEYER